jgi:hypothetical protein
MTKEDKEIQQIERQILLDKYTSALKKGKLINELKNGLGDEIKQKGGKVIIKKKTKLQRFKLWLKKIFTRF